MDENVNCVNGGGVLAWRECGVVGGVEGKPIGKPERQIQNRLKWSHSYCARFPLKEIQFSSNFRNCQIQALKDWRIHRRNICLTAVKC